MNIYKFLKDYGSYSKNAIVQFNDKQAKVLLADKIIELAKSNKKAKLSATKALISMLALGLGLGFAPAMAESQDYSVEVATEVITEAATMEAEIDNNSKFEMLTVSNSSTTIQVLGIYENCASTTTVSKFAEITVPASDTVTVRYDYINSGSGAPAHADVCFRKSIVATQDDLYLHVIYK